MTYKVMNKLIKHVHTVGIIQIAAWAAYCNMLNLLTLVILGIFCPIKSEPCLRENKACKLDAFNLVDVFENILEISECNEICKDNSECQYFSYHADEMIPSHYQKCYLLRLCNTVVDCSYLG